MPNPRKKVKGEFWVGVIVAVVIGWTLLAMWWKEHPVLGWIILVVLLAVSGYVLYKYASVRGWLGRQVKETVHGVVFEQGAPKREQINATNRQGSSKYRQSAATNKQHSDIKTCRYWNCNRSIRANHFLCPEHYQDLGDYLINKCPECGRYKDVEYEVCKDCYANLIKKNAVQKSDSQFRKEHSKAWEKGDVGVEKFFIYILKSETAEFYVGQTRDLRLRLGEHRDGKTKSISGRDSRLQYYEEVSSRESAELREVELKKLLHSNERMIRKMIQDFQDRVREVEIH